MSIRTLAAVALAALALPATAQEILFQQPSTFENADGVTVTDIQQGWIYSENFTVEANNGSDGYLADDFTVPEGRTWMVTSLSVIAFYANHHTFLQNPPDPPDPIVKATSFNVIVWGNDADAGTPSDTKVLELTEVAASSDNTGGGAGAGIISFDLATALELTEGTYWLTVQGNMPTETLGQDTRYFWGTNDAEFGEPLQWWNYGAGLTQATPCNQGWSDNTPCRAANSGSDPTLYLRLNGSVINASEEVAQSRTVSILSTRPNPATDRTLIPFTLREPADVRLAVYDVLGREVALVAERPYAAGEHAEPLTTADLAPGTYVVRLVAGSEVVLRTISVTR